MQKLSDQALIASAGITTAQAAVLVIIAMGKEVSQRHVAEQLGLNESAITAMVSRLLALDLLSRERHPDDARAYRLKLTKQGEAALKKGEKAFAETNRRLDTVLSEEELAQLADYLSRASKAFSG